VAPCSPQRLLCFLRVSRLAVLCPRGHQQLLLPTLCFPKMLPAIASKSKPRLRSDTVVSAPDSDGDSCSGTGILLEEQALSQSASSRTGSSRVMTEGLQQHQYAPIQTADCLPVLTGLSDSEGHRLAATARIRPSSITICRAAQVDQIEQTLGQWNWHVLPRIQGLLGDESLKPPVPNIPTSATGIFMLSEVKWCKFTCRYLADIRATYRNHPIVVILLDVPITLADADVMLEAQTALRYAGADDIIFAAESSEPVLKLTIAMATQRASWRGEDHEAMNQALQERETEEKAAERDKMFWSCAHRVFTGFPKIDPAVYANLGENASLPENQVGSTVLREKLGQGAFGTVHFGVDKETGHHEAVKVLEKSAIDELYKVCNLWREITLLRKLKHPGIVRLVKTLHTRRYVTIHMEVAGRMSLYDYISKNGGCLDMPQVWDLGLQIAEALSHCHSLDIAHRDIKHENLVISIAANRQPRVKIIDFGLAVEVGCYGTEQRCGTMPYCPPEMLRGVRNGVVSVCSAAVAHRADPRCADVWAFGIVNLEMAGGLGLLTRLLDWPDIVEPSEERGLELASLLGNGHSSLPKALQSFTLDLQREDHRHLKPMEVLRNNDLLQLIIGQMQLDVNKRLTMQEVEICMSNKVLEPAAPSERRSSMPRSLDETRRRTASTSEQDARKPALPSSGNDNGCFSPRSSNAGNYNSTPGNFNSTPVQPSTSRPATGTRPVQRRALTKSEAIAAVKEGLRW